MTKLLMVVAAAGLQDLVPMDGNFRSGELKYICHAHIYKPCK